MATVAVVGPTASGKSAVQVHGMFGIHGADHEITVPAEIELAPDHWTLAVHFAIPYVKWGLKDPSTFILRVSKTVDIDLHAGVREFLEIGAGHFESNLILLCAGAGAHRLYACGNPEIVLCAWSISAL